MVYFPQIKNSILLSGLADHELADFSKYLTPVHLEKNAYLFYRNDQSVGLYMLSKGSLQIIIDNDTSKEIIVYTVLQGDIVGEMTLYDETARSATVIAQEDCLLYKINKSKFIELLMIYPSIAVNLSKILINRLHAANDTIERLGMMSGNQKVTHFLKTLALREGSLENESFYLYKKPTYRQISKRLGLSEKTVYRTMQFLSKKGDIDIKGRKLFIKQSLIDSIS